MAKPKPPIIRVLVVDDSPTVRKLICAILETDPQLKVVGIASDGEEALSMCQALEPNVVTMDIHMPGMGGLEAIRHIMAESPRPILVLTSKESEVRLGGNNKSTKQGALMAMEKPRGLPSEDHKARELIEKIKTMAGVKVVGRRIQRQKKETAWASRTVEPAFRRAPNIVAIGASTGGPPALKTVLQGMPAELEIPVVVVQHISRGFVGGMARWLNDSCELTVKVAEQGELLQPATVYLAPDDVHLLVKARGRVSLAALPKVDGHRPSVTVLFESVAAHFGAGALGVLLTGMGSDGARGLKALFDAGAHTIAQDADSCVVFGMPKEAARMGAVKEMLPIQRIRARLEHLVQR